MERGDNMRDNLAEESLYRGMISFPDNNSSTEMSTSGINYNIVEELTRDPDPNRLKNFRKDFCLTSKKFQAVPELSSLPGGTTNLYLLNKECDRIAVVRDYLRIEISVFNEKKIAASDRSIKVSNPNLYSGISSLAWRPQDGEERAANWLSVGYFGGFIENWDTDTMTLLDTLEAPNSCQVTAITYSPDGAYLAVGCVSGEVYKYDIEHQEWSRFVVSRRHGNRVLHLHWDERGCFSIGWDGVMFLWDPRVYKAAQSSFVPCGNPQATLFEKNTLTIGTTERSQNLQQFDLSSNQAKLLHSQTVSAGQAGLSLVANDRRCEVQVVHRCRFAPGLFAVATSHNNTLKLFDDTAKGLVEVYSYESLPADYLLTVASASDTRRLFVGGKGYEGHVDLL